MFSSSLCLLGCGPHMASKTTKKKAQAPAVHNISLIVFAATPTGGGGGIPLAYLLAAAASPTFTILSDRTPTPHYRLAALLPKWRHTAIHPLLGTLLLAPLRPLCHQCSVTTVFQATRQHVMQRGRKHNMVIHLCCTRCTLHNFLPDGMECALYTIHANTLS